MSTNTRRQRLSLTDPTAESGSTLSSLEKGVVLSDTRFARATARHGVLMIRFRGPSVGQREAAILADDLNQALSLAGRSLRHLVLDMREVQMLSSPGLGLCIDLRKQAHKQNLQRGGKTILLGLTDELQQLFAMMKLSRLYTMVKDEPDLRKMLRK